MEQNVEWMEAPELRDIPLPKLQFLQNMLFESKKYTGKELFPFFMSLAMKAKSQNITYTQQEIDIIIPVLKKYATEDEIKKMDQVIKIFQTKNSSSK